MAAVDFQSLRNLISLARALELLGWRPTWNRWDHARGACPVHRSRSPNPRTFHVTGNAWYCHRCRQGGDVVDLWAAVHALDLHAAALDLCRRLGVNVPWKARDRRATRCPRLPRAQRRGTVRGSGGSPPGTGSYLDERL